MQTKPQTVVFLVHTEYHLLVALSVAADKYANLRFHKVIICLAGRIAEKKHLFNPNFQEESQIELLFVAYKEKAKSYDSGLHSFVKQLISLEISKFIIFNEHNFLPLYLAKKLSGHKVEICLGPDGTKPYGTFNKLALGWRLRFAVNFLKFQLTNKLSLVGPHIPQLKYASLKDLNKVWVQFPDFFPASKTHAQVVGINVLQSKEAIEACSLFFSFNADEEIIVREKTIFYINQPLRNPGIYDFEIQLLTELKQQFPGYKLSIKLHPFTDAAQIKRMKGVTNAIFYTKSYPAELYIAQLTDSVVISFWSAACLSNNPNTRIYWVHPLLKHAGLMIDYISFLNPTRHIIEAQGLNEIK